MMVASVCSCRFPANVFGTTIDATVPDIAVATNFLRDDLVFILLYLHKKILAANPPP